MFESFRLESCGKGLLGYRWEAANPAAVVCLLHGIGEYGGLFDGFAEGLKSHGISTFSFDLRGHGGSAGRRGHTGPRRTVLRDADSLLTYAHRAHAGLPIVLYGHSLGGNIALHYRLRGRLSALPAAYIAASPWLALCQPIPKWLYYLVKAAARCKPDFTIGAGIGADLVGNAQILEAMRGDRLIHDRISVLTALESFERADDLMRGRIADRCGGGEKPLFLMHGTADTICSIEATRAFAAAAGERCTLIEWEGCVHELHMGEQGKAVMERTAELVLRFRNPRGAGPA
ncbi:MAG: lysophospholipase [Clostridiales Family XIII bacterium]|jgi:alpha-beta hydrolase superfamily lysophospholipase|nr:lysophospholipase [Clostridiales Family XIII bacterium]